MPLLLWWSFDPGVIIGLLAVLNWKMSRAIGCVSSPAMHRRCMKRWNASAAGGASAELSSRCVAAYHSMLGVLRGGYNSKRGCPYQLGSRRRLQLATTQC